MSDRLQPIWRVVDFLADPDRLVVGLALVLTYIVVLTGTVLHFHTTTTGELMTLPPAFRWFLVGCAFAMRGIAAVGAALLTLGAIEYAFGGVTPEVTGDD
jgi:hypothetical protein